MTSQLIERAKRLLKKVNWPRQYLEKDADPTEPAHPLPLSTFLTDHTKRFHAVGALPQILSKRFQKLFQQYTGRFRVDRMINGTSDDRSAIFTEVVIILTIIMNMISIILLWTHDRGYDLSLNIGTGIIQAIAYTLLLKGRTTVVSIGFTVAIWAAITLAIFNWGGVLSPLYSAYLIAILTAGVSSQIWMLIAITGSSVGVGILLYWRNISQNLPPIDLINPQSAWAVESLIINTILFIFFAIIVTIRNRLLSNAIDTLKAKELLARKNNALYRAIVESQNEYIFRCDEQGRIIYANPAYLKYTGLEQVTGLYFTEINLSAANSQLLLETFQRAAEGSSHQQIETEDGRWIEWHFEQIVNGHVDYQAVGRDITHQRENERISFELGVEQAKVQFMQSLANDILHDIKTPLAVLGTSLYLLSKSDLPASQTRYLSQLESTSNEVRKIMEDMLVRIRNQSPGQVLRPTTFNISNMLQHIIQNSKTILKPNQTLTERIDPNLSIEAEEILIFRAITNLLNNAIIYTGPSGNITLTCRLVDNDKSVQIDVTDTGIGMDEEDRRQIFERFYRSEAAKAINSAGSGIGLNVVKTIIDMHKGTINVKSVPGKGSTFTVKLPVVSVSSVTSEPLVGPQSAAEG